MFYMCYIYIRDFNNRIRDKGRYLISDDIDIYDKKDAYIEEVHNRLSEYISDIDILYDDNVFFDFVLWIDLKELRDKALVLYKIDEDAYIQSLLGILSKISSQYIEAYKLKKNV